jgi:CBS domain-containing protein
MVWRLLEEAHVETIRPPALLVKDLMTASPICMGPTERLDIALALMASCRFRHLLVKENGRLVGVLSLRDVLAAGLSHVLSTAHERTLHLSHIAARDVMKAPVATVTPGDTIWDAAELLLQRHVSCLPVLQGERIMGIVTRTDFLMQAIELLRLETEASPPGPTVSRLMTACPLLTAAPTDHVDVAHAIMKAEHVRHLPVVEGERLVGMLSEHDILAAMGCCLPGEPPVERLMRKSALLVGDVMARRTATISADSSPIEAGRTLRRRRFGALPVVSGGRLSGIVSVSDYFYYLLSYAPDASVSACASLP